MRIVHLDDGGISLDGDIDFSGFAAAGDFQRYPGSSADETIERCRNAEVVVTNKAQVGAAAVAAAADLQLIAVTATGYDNVDTAAAKARGIPVCNVPGYAEYTVPQHAFALILNLATQAHRYWRDVENGDWQRTKEFTLLRYPTFELSGLSIGIIGFGAIGRGVARIAEALGMRVLVHDAFGIRDEAYPNTGLDDLLSTADFVTVHVPLNDQTRNLIDAQALARMKPTAMIINTARGGIVNEQALAEALNGDRIAGAGFDVLTSEPPTDGNPLLQAKNTIITPHSAWSTRESRQKLIDESVKNIRAFAAGTPTNRVV